MLKSLKFILRYFALKNLGLVLEKDMSYLGRERLKENLAGDYIRKSSLELVSYEIYQNEIFGSTAEVGVYKGDFAKLINFYFPDRKLYLFDTFEGFDKRDIEDELNKGFSKGNQDFSDTSIKIILSKMSYKENVIIKKGYFPESAIDITDEEFCFVSIDVDLYKPTKAALEFFYPRLNNGGYIFVHDFNNSGYKGVREAVIEFSKKYKVGYFPLSDGCGTAVIIK